MLKKTSKHQPLVEAIFESLLSLTTLPSPFMQQLTVQNAINVRMSQLGVRLSTSVLEKLFIYASAVELPEVMGHFPKSKELAVIQNDLIEIGQRLFYNTFHVEAQLGGLVADICADDITKPLAMAEMLGLSFSLTNDSAQLRLKGRFTGMRVLDYAPGRSLYRDVVLGGPFRQGEMLCESDSDAPLRTKPSGAETVSEKDCMLLFDITLPMVQNPTDDLAQNNSITIQLNGFHCFVVCSTVSDWLLLACRYADVTNFVENIPAIMKAAALVLGDYGRILPETKIAKLSLLANDFRVYLPKHSQSHEAVRISFAELTARNSRLRNDTGTKDAAKIRLSKLEQKIVLNLTNAKIMSVGVQSRVDTESSEIDTLLQVGATDRTPKILRALWKSLVDHGGLRSGRIFRVSPDPNLKEQIRAKLAAGSSLSAEDLATFVTDAHVAASLIKDHFNALKPKLLQELKEDTLLELCEMSLNELKIKLPEKLHPERLELLEWLLDRCNELAHSKSPLDIHSVAVIIAPLMFSKRALWSKNGHAVPFLERAIYCRQPRDESVIPKQLRALWQCLLSDNGLSTEGIFRVPASSLISSATEDAMTEAYYASVGKLASMCPSAVCASSLIKRHFRHLKPRMFEPLDEKTVVGMTNLKRLELFAALESELTDERMTLLRWLLDSCVAVACGKNKMTIEALAIVFVPNLFPDELIRFTVKEGKTFFAHVIKEYAQGGLNPRHIALDFYEYEDENEPASTILRLPSAKCTLGADKSLLALDLHVKPAVLNLDSGQAGLIYSLFYENLLEPPQQLCSADAPLNLFHLLDKTSSSMPHDLAQQREVTKPRDLMIQVAFEGAQIFYSTQEDTGTRSKTSGKDPAIIPMLFSKIGKTTARFNRDRKSLDAAVTLTSLFVQDRRPNLAGKTQILLETDQSEDFLRAKIGAKIRSRGTRGLKSLSVKARIQPLNLLVNDLLVDVFNSVADSQPMALPELPHHLSAFWRAAGKKLTAEEIEMDGAPRVLMAKGTGLREFLGDAKDPFEILGRVQIDVDLKQWNVCILRDLEQQTRDSECISLQFRRIAIGGSSTSIDDVKYLVGVDRLRLCLLAVDDNLTVTRSAQVENGAALKDSLRASLSQDLLQPVTLTLKAKSSLTRWKNATADDAKQDLNAEDDRQPQAVLQVVLKADPVRMTVSELALEQVTTLAAQFKFVLGRLQNPLAKFKAMKAVIRRAMQKRKTSNKLWAIKKWVLETVPLDFSFSMLECDLYTILPAADMSFEMLLRLNALRVGVQTDGRNAEMQIG